MKSRRVAGDRRIFLKSCGCALAGLAVAPFVGGCEFSHVTKPASSIDDGGALEIDVSSLASDGAMLLTSEKTAGGRLMVVVRTSAVSYLVFVSTCPHAGYPVAPADTVIRCTGGHGHGSLFDLDGTAIAGPAVGVGNLTRLEATYDEQRRILTIHES